MVYGSRTGDSQQEAAKTLFHEHRLRWTSNNSLKSKIILNLVFKTRKAQNMFIAPVRPSVCLKPKFGRLKTNFDDDDFRENCLYDIHCTYALRGDPVFKRS